MYKKIVVTEFSKPEGIRVEEHALADLRKGLNNDNTYLVKLHAAPINPLDILKISGQIFSVKVPFTPGSEGSGVIVEGSDPSLIGRKVSFNSAVGTWSEYSIVSLDSLILLPDDADLDSSAVGYVNPLTAIGLVSRAQELGAKGVVNLAATSTLGKMVNDLAIERGLNVLNVIRGDAARVKHLQEHFKNENVISLDDAATFQQELKERAEKLSTTVAFDPIGGAVTGQVFNNLPPNSHLLVYGSLSNKDIEGINGVQVRWANKKLEGFVAFSWLGSRTKEQKAQTKAEIVQKSKTIFATPIEKAFSFDQVNAGIALLKTLKGGSKVIVKVAL